MIMRLVTVGWLLVVWVALWGDVTVANVLSGLLVAGGIVAVFPVGRRRPGTARLRIVPAFQLVAYFLWKLVEANVIVAWEVITPSNVNVREAIVAAPISDAASDTVVAIIANAISLTPGTLTVEVRRHPTVLYVHVLHLRSIEQTRIEVLQLERYVMRALGTPDAVVDVERRLAEARSTTTPATGDAT